MIDVLLEYFRRSWSPTQDEIDLIRSQVTERILHKGDFLQREGDIVKYGAFVAKGFLRSYIIDHKGNEHIIQFAPENWWVTGRSGFLPDTTGVFFIDAIEDSVVCLMEPQNHATLLRVIPGYATAFRVKL